MKIKALFFLFALMALASCTSGTEEYVFFDDSANPGEYSGFDGSGNVNWVVLTPDEQRATKLSLINASIIRIGLNLLPILGNPGFAFNTQNYDPYPDPKSLYIAAYKQLDKPSNRLILWTFVFNSSEDADASRSGFSIPGGENDVFRVLHKGNTFVEVGNGFSKIDPGLIDSLADMLSQRLDMPLLEKVEGDADS